MNRGGTRAIGPFTSASAWNRAAPTTPPMPASQTGRRTRASSRRSPPPRATVEAALRWKAVPMALLAAPMTAKHTANPITGPRCPTEGVPSCRPPPVISQLYELIDRTRVPT